MRIAIHAFDGISMFHLATPLAVFGEVARLGLADWQTVVWTDAERTAGPIRTAEGVSLGDLSGAEVLDRADVVVFGSWPTSFVPAAPSLVEAIRAAHDRGAVVVGLCLGAFPVADAGLLDGRAAVTHWFHAELLARRHREVEVRAEALHIDHGDVLTSAGTAAGLDACLHLVRSRLGAGAAVRVARSMVVAPHRDGNQAQYLDRPVPPSPGVGPIATTMAWASDHLDEALTVATLAQRAGMSPRHFTRRFRETVGTTPAQWLAARRLDHARRLLESTDFSIARVARACGFASPVTFRQNFVARHGTTPTAHRRQFVGLAQVLS